MLATVIIPTYNSARFLEESVRSVFEQTYCTLECIVVDDGSTDRTQEILQLLVKRYPALKVARKKNGGPSSARNLGLRLCTGDVVSFLDADDVLLPDKIERQVEYLQQHSEVDIVYGDYLVVTENLAPLALFTARIPPNMHPFDAFAYRNWFNPLVPLIRRKTIQQVGAFDEDLQVAEDWDYWIRCAKVARMAHIQGAVALYRQHGEQVHRNHARMRRACLRVAAKHFGEDQGRMRTAMAGIDLNDARHLWRQGKIFASIAALFKYTFTDGCGLRMGGIWQQMAAMTQSQLKPL